MPNVYITDNQLILNLKYLLYLCSRKIAVGNSYKRTITNLFQMLKKILVYTKLAWVYAKGICGCRHKMYDLQFVYVPEDKLWYIDMPWPGDRYNLAMVAGSNHLLKYLDKEEKNRVRVLVYPSKKKLTGMENEGYFELVKQFSRMLGGATYKVNGMEDFSREIWICPVTLCVLGHYPDYIYIKQIV